MSVRHGLLGILAKRPRHGYELKAAFDEISGGFWDLNYGQIYSTLDRMVREGLVEVVSTEADGARERKSYAITVRGLREFREWLSRPVDRPRPLRDELFVKLAFLDPSDPEPILRLIENHRRHYLTQMALITQRRFQLDSQPEGGDRLMAGLLVDAALFHAEADLRWLDHCEARIREWAERERGAQG